MIRILSVCLILSGCSVLDSVRKNIYMTDQEKQEAKKARFAEHRAKCTELGFNLGNVEHTNCVLGLEQSWIQAEAVKRAASSMSVHAASQPQPLTPMPAPVIIFAD